MGPEPVEGPAPLRPPEKGRSPKGAAPPPRAGASEVYRHRPVFDPVVPIFYLLLLGAVLWLLPRFVTNLFAIEVLAGVLVLYFLRQITVYYTIDEDHLNAWRLFGWRRVPLTSIRRIEEISLRDLSPTGLFGTWGWRSRLWSPTAGKFDAIYTFHKGLMVVTDEVPLFLSPRDREGFGEELARRVEAAGGALESLETAS